MRRYTSQLVSKYLTHKLIAIVGEMQRMDVDQGAAAFPVELAAHARRPLVNAALEFINATCHVLALDARVAGEVARLRRALLAQIGAREFGADAAFADPCDSFVLPDVICGSCRACRALDLCRDAQQRPGDADDAAAASSRHWACEQCAQPYARAAIEQQLVELVQRRATRYQLQDLRCVRCHRVATRLMAGACQCGGKLALDTPPGEFLAEMRTLGRIARAHELPLLAAQIEHVTH